MIAGSAATCRLADLRSDQCTFSQHNCYPVDAGAGLGAAVLRDLGASLRHVSTEAAPLAQDVWRWLMSVGTYLKRSPQ